VRKQERQKGKDKQACQLEFRAPYNQAGNPGSNRNSTSSDLNQVRLRCVGFMAMPN